MLSGVQGKELLEFARYCVLSELNGKKIVISPQLKEFNQKQGLFVTIHKNGELRGCIGFVIGHYPLYEGIKHAAHSAAFEDTRFRPVNIDEWGELDFEISVLTLPEKINVLPKELPDNIEIGKDGLICECGSYAGLLLPQVATEYNWNSKQFLGHTCEKAGIPSDTWKSGKCSFKKFQAQIFKEK